MSNYDAIICKVRGFIRSGDDIPLEFGRVKYGAAFSEWLNDPNYSAIQHGRNLDVIFNCTYELHQFTSHPILLKILKDLKLEYKDVLFFTINREMSTKEVGELLDQTDRTSAKYLELFFPFQKPDFEKKGKDSAWFIGDDRTMLALAMTFRKEPDAQIMCFLRDYAERYDWLVQVFQDWSFTFLSSFLYYEDYDEKEEETREIYRAGMPHSRVLPRNIILS